MFQHRLRTLPNRNLTGGSQPRIQLGQLGTATCFSHRAAFASRTRHAGIPSSRVAVDRPPRAQPSVHRPLTTIGDGCKHDAAKQVPPLRVRARRSAAQRGTRADGCFGAERSDHLAIQPVERQTSHARTSRSTVGSVQRAHQLWSRRASPRPACLQALGARFGDEWAPATVRPRPRSSPIPGLANPAWRMPRCQCRVASAAPALRRRWSAREPWCGAIAMSLRQVRP